MASSEQNKRWYQKHREEILAKRKAHYEANSEQILASKSARYRNDPLLRERRKEAARSHYANNKEARKEVTDRRRARIAGSQINDFTERDWIDLLELYEYRCAYCGSDDRLTRDHMIPLVKGGPHTKANIVPACAVCNSEKRTKELEEFLPGFTPRHSLSKVQSR